VSLFEFLAVLAVVILGGWGLAVLAMALLQGRLIYRP